MTREEAINSFKKSNEQTKINIQVHRHIMDTSEIREREWYIERNEMAIKALEQEPKTGHWIFQDITQGKRMWCSNCNSAFDLCCNQIKRYDEATKKEYLWGHCPWCGAKVNTKAEKPYPLGLEHTPEKIQEIYDMCKDINPEEIKSHDTEESLKDGAGHGTEKWNG